MKIVFFVTALDSGGMENYLLRFLTETHHRFHEVYVWCKSGRDGQLDASYASLANVELVKEKLGYLDFSSYKRLRDFIQVKNINIVCDFSGNFSGRVVAVAKKAGVTKRVSAYRGASDHFKKSPWRSLYNEWVRYLTYKHSTDIISNSKAGLNYFFPNIWELDSRFSVIYNGINPETHLAGHGDLRGEFSIPEGGYVIGHTGRFNSAKNHSTILAVAEKLVGKYPDIYFILCGNGVNVNLGRELESKGLGSRVLTFENRVDIRRFLNTMDCYFFPSVTEGQPNALIEAMIVGLPFVASDITPIRETVGEGYELYPAMNTDELAAALEKKYLAREGRSIRQQNEMVDRFDYKKRFDEFYRLLVSVR